MISRVCALIAVCCAVSFITTQAAFASDKADHPHWGYEGEEGPAHWGDLKPEYEKCTSGQQQSPIDLTGAVAQDLGDIDFTYRPVPLNVVDNGHTVQVNIAPGSSASIRGESYSLLQFHFHSPSENVVDGKPYPMEMHLVHEDGHGRLAVVGVFITEGAANDAIGTAWQHLPETGHSNAPEGVSVNPKDLLPDDRAYYHFAGSLTTPPCSEGVNWNVFRSPIELSAEQIANFRKRYPNNARPVQPLNDRILVRN